MVKKTNDLKNKDKYKIKEIKIKNKQKIQLKKEDKLFGGMRRCGGEGQY